MAIGMNVADSVLSTSYKNGIRMNATSKKLRNEVKLRKEMV
jgi:hypothetical protein